jgi:hypothetical protein
MGSVEAPEERDGVICPMDAIEGEVKQDDGRRDGGEGVQAKVMEQSPRLGLGVTAHEDQHPAEQKVHRNGVAPRDYEVGGGMTEP